MSFIRGFAAAWMLIVGPGGWLQSLWMLERDAWRERRGIGRESQLKNSYISRRLKAVYLPQLTAN
jgi:hypothetical protein